MTETPDNQANRTPVAEESIAPIRRDGAAGPSAPGREPATGRVPPMAWIGATLIVLLLVVFIALPRWMAPPPERELPVEAPAAPVADDQPPALSPQEIAALRAEAETDLAAVLELDGRLTRRSANVWGGEDYLAFDAATREGDDAFLADDFVLALDRYATALEIGQALIERSDAIMSAALDAGDAAIAAGNATLAAEQYGIVLSVDPESARAIAGAARAERLPEVLAAVDAGNAARQSGDLETAQATYREALAIDPDWAPASRALAEVTTALANAGFERTLSRGFAALGEQDYDDAIEAFERALASRPGSEAAADGLAQAVQGQKLDAIALAEARALAFERRELWNQAIARYEAALETDPTLAFAVDGLRRSRARADLDSKLTNLIDNPRLLLDDEILADARDVLADAQSVSERGQRIDGQTERLSTLIAAASAPVAVMFESDAMTEVTVFRYGSLGTFDATQIELRPGTYTVVGSRRGYRDVRTTFTVLPGRELPPVQVVCVEPI